VGVLDWEDSKICDWSVVTRGGEGTLNADFLTATSAPALRFSVSKLSLFVVPA